MTDHLHADLHQHRALHRGRRRPPRGLRITLGAVKAVALGGLLSMLVLSGFASSHPAGSQPTDRADQVIVERAMTNQQCSPQGFDESTIPASALIRTPAGRVRVVSFAHGWDVYQGRRPGSLIAVCLRDRPQR